MGRGGKRETDVGLPEGLREGVGMTVGEWGSEVGMTVGDI